MGFDVLHGSGGVPVKMWTRGVPVEESAREQLRALARLPVVWPHIAVMPDVHLGIGATVGAVVPTRRAIIPAAVGVDIGCGMIAVRTSLRAIDLPDQLRALRLAIEAAVPHGRTAGGGRGDRGAWRDPPAAARRVWAELESDFRRLVERHPRLQQANHVTHLGTLGTGNHFIELCLDEADAVWVMLHSGSRGVGNAIGTHFIELAKQDMRRHLAHLPDADLAYFEEGAEHFEDYVFAVDWAQRYARANRALMLESVLEALRRELPKPFRVEQRAVNCHHNYVERERHYGSTLWVTRKGAVRARRGELGIIPGSMGAPSYVVRGRGEPESFCSCSHGAGRVMSRGEARRRISLEQHRAATRSVECRKDAEVLDESPAAYKPIDRVMAAQDDLVEIVHTLRPVLCVKG